MISCRRKARESALQALYQCDALGDWSSASIDLYFSTYHAEDSEGKDDPDAVTFCRSVIEGVIKNIEAIDTQISSASTHWSVTRMSRVDRNILRLAAFEIAYLSDIPVKVTINEAIEIAKRFSSDDSPMFINGVLDNVARVHYPTGKNVDLDKSGTSPGDQEG